jgi:hypothetical protein
MSRKSSYRVLIRRNYRKKKEYLVILDRSGKVVNERYLTSGFEEYEIVQICRSIDDHLNSGKTLRTFPF